MSRTRFLSSFVSGGEERGVSWEFCGGIEGEDCGERVDGGWCGDSLGKHEWRVWVGKLGRGDWIAEVVGEDGRGLCGGGGKDKNKNKNNGRFCSCVVSSEGEGGRSNGKIS